MITYLKFLKDLYTILILFFYLLLYSYMIFQISKSQIIRAI